MTNNNITRRDLLKIAAGLLVGMTTLPLWRFLSGQDDKGKKTVGKHMREAKHYVTSDRLAG